MSDDEYEEELRLVRKKKGTQRSKSSKSDEFESDLLRDKRTKNVAGPTESRPVDEEELRQKYQGDPIFLTSEPARATRREPTPAETAFVDALAEVGSVVIHDFLAPLMREVALPAAKQKLSDVAERRRIRKLQRAEARSRALEAKVIKLEVEIETEALPVATDVAVPEPAISMNRSELLLAQLQLKLAEDYAARQRWLITHSDVTNEDLSPELEKSVMRMLEGRGDELDDKEREAVTLFLRQTGDVADTRYAPLPLEPEDDE